jgi:hypothetical protein
MGREDQREIGMASVRFWIALALLAAPSAAWAKGVPGISPDGEKGWLHTVDPGDTLWDITAQYLGSPWIWPSVWRDNEIANPHRIEPGDLIWITERGMRMLSADEASRIAPLPGEPGAQGQEAPAGPISGTLPAALSPESAPRAPGEGDPFAALDRSSSDLQAKLKFPGLHRYGFVSALEAEGSAAVLGSHDENYWASQERRTIVGIGEGRVHVGDRFTLFRTRKRIDHPTTGEKLGFLIERLGTGEITEIHTESSFLKVISSYAEIQPGDRLIPYEEEPTEFPTVHTDIELDGIVVAVQLYRQYAVRGDIVLIDRGADHGVVSGNRFELFRAGKEVLDPVTAVKTLVPDDTIGELMVLKVSGNTSLALLTRSDRMVHPGDHFRSR